MRAAEMSAEGQSIYKHDPRGKVAVAYESLTAEILEKERVRETVQHEMER